MGKSGWGIWSWDRIKRTGKRFDLESGDCMRPKKGVEGDRKNT